MIQFNLLPDVKLEYIKATRTKRLVMSVAILVAGIGLTIFTLLFINVNFLQKQHINNLTKDIDENKAKLQAIEDIDKVLTVQNQLNSLSTLHEQKPATERILPYLSKLTPQAANISQSVFNFTDSKATINGTADSSATVNKFVDTLKFTKFTVDGTEEEQNAFSEVVLTTFSINDDEATYQIDFKFNPEIFNNTKKIELVVPNIISTRSQTEKPTDLFKEPVNQNGN